MSDEVFVDDLSFKTRMLRDLLNGVITGLFADFTCLMLAVTGFGCLC